MISLLNETRVFEAMKQLRELQHEIGVGKLGVTNAEAQAIIAVGPALRAIWDREVTRNNDALEKARRAYRRNNANPPAAATKTNNTKGTK
jgi:hypothetical protein